MWSTCHWILCYPAASPGLWLPGTGAPERPQPEDDKCVYAVSSPIKWTCFSSNMRRLCPDSPWQEQIRIGSDLGCEICVDGLGVPPEACCLQCPSLETFHAPEFAISAGWSILNACTGGLSCNVMHCDCVPRCSCQSARGSLAGLGLPDLQKHVFQPAYLHKSR